MVWFQLAGPCEDGVRGWSGPGSRSAGSAAWMSKHLDISIL